MDPTQKVVRSNHKLTNPGEVVSMLHRFYRLLNANTDKSESHWTTSREAASVHNTLVDFARQLNEAEIEAPFIGPWSSRKLIDLTNLPNVGSAAWTSLLPKRS